MADSLSKLYVHLVFSTKNRTATIRKMLLPELWAYAAGVLKQHRCPPIAIGGTMNHVHALFVLDKTMAACDIARTVKATTSKWYTDETHYPFEWQKGYAIFSVSSSKVDIVRQYIQRQEDHHSRHTFEEEMRAFFDQYQVAYDERYVWG